MAEKYLSAIILRREEMKKSCFRNSKKTQKSEIKTRARGSGEKKKISFRGLFSGSAGDGVDKDVVGDLMLMQTQYVKMKMK
jgi:hypothetical protein